MKILATRIGFVIVLCLGGESLAWDTPADFTCAATNALADDFVLVSTDFGNALTNFIAISTNHQSQLEARLVLGERYLARYNETMNGADLRNAFCVASNICDLTRMETNTWHCWQGQLLLFSCHARNNDTEGSYNVASNALATIGAQDIRSDNIVLTALSKRNKVQGLSVRQTIVLANALSAAMLKRRDEAEALALALPIRYRNMVIRLADSEDWIR